MGKLKYQQEFCGLIHSKCSSSLRKKKAPSRVGGLNSILKLIEVHNLTVKWTDKRKMELCSKLELAKRRRSGIIVGDETVIKN